MIQSERWHQIEQICEAELKRQPSERAAFLKEACGEDEALRREVAQLLSHEETAKTFLEAPALEAAGRGSGSVARWPAAWRLQNPFAAGRGWYG